MPNVIKNKASSVNIPLPLLTCEPVLAEASFLLCSYIGDLATPLRAVQKGYLPSSFKLAKEAKALETFIKRHDNSPMSLANTHPAWLTEFHKEYIVPTLDRDFKTDRWAGQ